MFSSTASFFLLLAPLVLAANFDVNVGEAGLNFTPDHVQDAKSGDTVIFRFFNGGHTVTQSTLSAPCTPRGFDSGVVDNGGTYQLKLNTTDPVWIFCATRVHCSSGMVFAVNPGDKLSQFQNTASGLDPRPPSSITGSSSTISPSESTTSATGTNVTSTRTSSTAVTSASNSPQNNESIPSKDSSMLATMTLMTLVVLGITVA
ncbi:hypothetical protein FRC17_000704 [Serendipita sp. 399]|nr:hypothetical protein FRC17_000704 [Serendipita sp. 399]